MKRASNHFPIALHITLFHAFLAPGGLAIALIIDVAGIILAKSRWNTFKSLFDDRGRITCFEREIDLAPSRVTAPGAAPGYLPASL